MNSPWGYVQHSTPISEGVQFVSTAGHGGFMLTQSAMKQLHPALKRASVYGGQYLGYTCFEEDCEAVAVLYELQEAGIDINAVGFKPATKEDVKSYLGHGDTYTPYLKSRGII